MHVSTIVSSAALMMGLMAQGGLATIAYGKSSANEPIAWIYGESECQYVRIAGAGQNPCEKKFKLSNGYTYFLRGCGGAGLTLFNGDGSFNANCKFGSKNLQCGVRREWLC